MSAALTVSAHHPTADVLLPVADLGNRAEWLEARRQGVTATDMRVLMGLGYAGETVFGRWLEKVEPPVDDDDDEAEKVKLQFRLGHAVEEAVARELASQRAIGVARVGMLRHKTTRTLLASPDRSTSDGGLVEIKRSSKWYLDPIGDLYPDIADRWRNLDGYVLPPAWRVQAQHQLLVSGRSHVYVCALVAERNDVTTWTVQADGREQNLLAELADMFWTHVVAGDPPPVEWDNLTKAEIAQRWPSAAKPSVLADDVVEVRDMIARRAQMKTDLDAIELRLKGIAGDAVEVVDEDGKKIYSYGNRSRRDFQWKAFHAAHPEIVLEPFFTESEFRALSFPRVAKPKRVSGLSTAPLIRDEVA